MTPAESRAALTAALVHVGHLIEEAPRHERREVVRLTVQTLDEERRLDFLIGVFIWAHELRQDFSALDDVAPLRAQVAAVEALIDPAAGMAASTISGVRYFAEGDIRKALALEDDDEEEEQDDGDSGPLCGFCGVRRPRPGFTACDSCA